MTDLPDLLAAWRLWQTSQNLSSRTIDERERVLRDLLGPSRRDPLRLTPDDIMIYTTRPEIGPASRATYHATIRAYCKWLVRTGRRADDPSAMTPSPRRPRGVAQPVPSDGLVRMLAVTNRRRTRMMILLATLGGLRVHEIAKFHGYDLDLTNGVITVTGKGGSTEIIPAHDDIVTAALEFPRDDWWFTSYTAQTSTSGHIGKSAVYGAIAGVMKRAGVRSTPHKLRHWYGTELLAAGVDIRVVQELMRHASITSTQRYTRVDLGRMRLGMAKLRLPEPAPV